MKISRNTVSEKSTAKLLAALTMKTTASFLEEACRDFGKFKSVLASKILHCSRSAINMAKQAKDKGLTKDRLVGMKVIDSKGYVIGTVKDIGFTVGKLGISLTMEDNEGEIKEIAWDQVQAAGDFVLLRPQSEIPTVQPGPQAPVAHVCPTCQGPLSYIQQYQRWYCYRCQKYV